MSSMRRALSSQLDQDDSDIGDAGFKAFTMSDVPSPLTGANAVPVTSTPVREPAGQRVVEEGDEEMQQDPQSLSQNF